MPKEQRHFVTADLLEATTHKQCCPKNNAILLRAFLFNDIIEVIIRIIIIRIVIVMIIVIVIVIVLIISQLHKLAFPHPTLDQSHL